MRELPAAEQDLCLLDVSLRKPPQRRRWRKQQGGFEEVSRFPCHNVAGNRLTRRCSESPKRRQKPMVSGLPFLSRVAFVMGRKGDRLCNKPAAAPSQVKGRVGLPLGGGRIPTTSLRTGRGNDRGWQGRKRALSPVGRAPFCMEKYQSLT